MKIKTNFIYILMMTVCVELTLLLFMLLLSAFGGEGNEIKILLIIGIGVIMIAFPSIPLYLTRGYKATLEIEEGRLIYKGDLNEERHTIKEIKSIHKIELDELIQGEKGPQPVKPVFLEIKKEDGTESRLLMAYFDESEIDKLLVAVLEQKNDIDVHDFKTRRMRKRVLENKQIVKRITKKDK